MSRPRFLLDTGPLVAFLDKTEQYHFETRDLIASLPTPFYTCEAVISEACFLLRRVWAQGSQQIFTLAKEEFFQVALQFEEAKERIAELVYKYRDVPMSFADACLVACAEKYQEPRILTFDKGFQVYRWGKGRGKKFQILSA